MLSALGSNETAITLTWAEPTPTDSLPLLRYHVHCDEGVAGSFRVVYNSTAMNVFTFTHTGLTPGIPHAYWLQVENVNGLSPDLAELPASHVTRYSCALPATFESLRISAKTATAISLVWEEPIGDTGCAVDGYTVLADDGLGGTLTAIALPGAVSMLAGTQFVLEMTTATYSWVVGREYRYVVVAHNPVGTK